MLLFPLCSEGARVCRPPHCEPLARRVGTAPTPQPTPASRCPAGVSRQGPRAPPLRAERERRRPRPAGEAGRGPGPVGSAARSRFSTFPCEARDRGRLSVGPSDKAKLERHPPPKMGGGQGLVFGLRLRHLHGWERSCPGTTPAGFENSRT